MPTKCFSPMLGRAIRVTELDDCGNLPASGALDTVVVTGGFTTLSLSAETEDGTEILVRRADGSYCINEKFADFFKRLTVEIEFCGVNPSLYTLITNADPYQDYEDEVAGFTIAEGMVEKTFALELWTGVTGVACEPGSSPGGYLLLPFVNAGLIGDLEINGEDAITFSMTGAYTKGGNQWLSGPYLVMDDAGTPAVLPTPLDPLDHLLLVTTTVAPPEEQCDPMPFVPAA
jgi:hypothetical protein